jgi:hypothetical protein
VPHVQVLGGKEEEGVKGGIWGDRERYWTAVTDAPVHVKLRLREARDRA